VPEPSEIAASTPEGVRQHRFVAPPNATTILLVRHGESAAAVADEPFPLRDGHGDPPLHPEGVAQAQALGARLAAEVAGGDRVDAIYVTSLQRTHQTAAPLAAALGLDTVEVPELREVHLGDWEGGAFRMKAAEGDPAFLRMVEHERWDELPGSEPHADFSRRLRAGIERIVAAHPGGRVVSVSHGGVIGELLAIATGSRGFAFVGADNASISEMVVDGDRWTLRRFNDTAHLHGIPAF
jgi:probable phosphoglycerate mutase